MPEYALPDAGQPTSNLTETAEYKPASSNEDTRIIVSNNILAKWWKRFVDPILESLIEGGVSNNVGYLMAQRRLEEASWELLGSYANFMPTLSGRGSWTRYWYHPRTRSGGGNRVHYNVTPMQKTQADASLIPRSGRSPGEGHGN